MERVNFYCECILNSEGAFTKMYMAERCGRPARYLTEDFAICQWCWDTCRAWDEKRLKMHGIPIPPAVIL